MAIRNLQISSMVETIAQGQRFISFDVSLSGHLIATISARHEHGRLIWSQASMHGFEDFDHLDREAIEEQLRAIWVLAGNRSQMH